MSMIVSPETTEKRATFFRFAFKGGEGLVCIARRPYGTKVFEETFFPYPDESEAMLAYIDQFAPNNDMWFCTQLLRSARRIKANVVSCPTVWADLDTCHPRNLLVKPSITVESSPGKWQAYWVFDGPLDPADAEDISRRIAYKHADEGADKSGWDLTQVLRIPLTRNFKYKTQHTDAPLVGINNVYANVLYTIEDFDVYPEAEDYEYTAIEMPEPAQLDVAADDVMMQHRMKLHPHVWHLYAKEPIKDWSKDLWQLELLLFESGLSREEVFIIVREAACNKYARDGKSDKLLWREVCKAETRLVTQQDSYAINPNEGKDALLTDVDRQWVKDNPGFVEEYVTWGKDLGDAAWQYHQAGAFVVLSSLLAGAVRLPTSFGTVVPNLWVMILADTTLTRKTTAMDMAMDLLAEVDPDAVLATDGSIEGLFTSLSMRPGRPSVFLRDEFSGLLEQFSKRDYYAGMAETLTKLYDGKFQKRVLRKEIIEVREPVLVLFAGGIKTRIQALLNHEHVASGFLPRFVLVTAESDVTSLKPLGPPTVGSTGRRNEIANEMGAMFKHYRTTQLVTVNDREVLVPRRWDADLSPDAWLLYNKFEADMLSQSMHSNQPEIMTPTLDRLAKSGLKAAVLLAAARQREERLLVEEQDIIRAFYYVEQWRVDTLEIIRNIGLSTQERILTTLLNSIVRHPGVQRSTMMRWYHLNKREADLYFDTLEQRGVIVRARQGKGETYHPVVTEQGGPRT